MPTRRQALATLAAPAFLAAQPPSDQVRAAIVGVGGRGSADLKSIVGAPNVKLVAVCDIDPAARDRGATIGKDHKPELLEDWRKLVERKDLDAVIIATPVDLHAEMASAALDAGTDVYLEKPMGVDEQDVKTVMDAAGRARDAASRLSAPLRPGAPRRHRPHPPRRHRRDRLHAGDRHGGDLPRDKDWIFDASRSGNIIVEQAVHILDLMNWATKTHPLRAMGSGGINVYKNVPPGRTIYDNYAVIYEYPNDVRLTFTHIYIDPPGFTGIQERIWGSEGAVDLPSGTFYELTERGEERVPPRKLFEGDRGNMNQLAMNAFFEHVRARTEPLNNALYGKYATLAAIMGRKAIDEKRFVTWEEVDL
ncbi:MAG: Gfo/Idh/MocA family oxidoreductase [Bryobacterales bacterium]